MGTMFGSGICLGVILDFYQVLKARFRLKGWIVSLIDLLYWFVSTGLVFSLLMWSNWGDLRFYVFFAILFGVFLYYRWLHRLVKKLLQQFIQLLESAIYRLYQLWLLLVWGPIIWSWGILLKLLTLIWKAICFVGRGILWPLEWGTRPIRNWLRPYYVGICQSWKALKQRLVRAWKKLTKKGDA